MPVLKKSDFSAGSVLTLSVMHVLMTHRSGGLELTFDPGLCGSPGIPCGTHHHFNVPVIEDIDGSSPHTAGDNDIHALIIQKVRKKSRPVSRIGYALLPDDLVVFHIKQIEIQTMTKMFRDRSRSLATAILTIFFSSAFPF